MGCLKNLRHGMGGKSWIPNWKQLEQHFVTNLLPVNIIRYKMSILEFLWSKEYSRPIYWSAKNIPSRWTSFSGKTAYFSKAMLNCTLHLFPHNCFIVKNSLGAALACLHSRPVTTWKHLSHYEMKNMSLCRLDTKEDPRTVEQLEASIR